MVAAFCWLLKTLATESLPCQILFENNRDNLISSGEIYWPLPEQEHTEKTTITIGTDMLEIKFLRQNLPKVKHALNTRQSKLDLSKFEDADDSRRNVLLDLEGLRHERNVVSNRIAELKKEGVDAQKYVEQMRKVATRIKSLESSLAIHEETFNKVLMEIPNSGADRRYRVPSRLQRPASPMRLTGRLRSFACSFKLSIRALRLERREW